MEENATKALEALLDDPDAHVRLSAASALLEHTRFLTTRAEQTYRRCGCR